MDTHGLLDFNLSENGANVLGLLSFLMSSKVIFNVRNQFSKEHAEYIFVRV